MGRRQSNRKGGKTNNKKRNSAADEGGNSNNTSSSSTTADGGDAATTTSTSTRYNGDTSKPPLPLTIGTRVELPHLLKSNKTHTGTVAGHYKKQKGDTRIAPYLMLMDDGTALYCHRTDPTFIYETQISGMPINFNIGCRVECQLNEGSDKWFPGTIIQAHPHWAKTPLDSAPYFIRFDYGRERPFWGPKDKIRELKGKDTKNRLPTLRFGVGDRVSCYMDGEWRPGKVVKTWYKEDDFENDHAAPYQVVLDTGGLIYAPMDDEECIKKCSLPPPKLRFGVGDKVKCRVEGGWEPGIISNVEVKLKERRAYYPYDIKLDIGEFVYAPVDSDMFIRKVLRFKKGDRVECYSEETDSWMFGEVADTEVDDEAKTGRILPYKARLDNGDELYIEVDDDSYIKYSDAPRICRGEQNGFVHVMSRMLIYNEEYEEAREMLQDRIEMTRANIENNNNVTGSRVDLSYFLCYLADVHQATKSLDEMKAALEESLGLIELSNDASKPHRLLNVTSKLATHAALNNDKFEALRYSEKAILLAKETTLGQDSFRMGLLLFQTGKLNVACNKRQRGLSQMSDGISILERLYGSDNEDVASATEEYKRISRDDDGAAVDDNLDFMISDQSLVSPAAAEVH